MLKHHKIFIIIIINSHTFYFIHFKGGFNYSKLKPFNKVLMTLLKWKLKMKKELTPDEKGMLASYDKPVDFTRKKDIDKIISIFMSLCR